MRLNEDIDQIPQRPLGKTRTKVGILSLGGQGALETHRGRQDDMVNIINRAYELGINYFDTSPVYGPSEDYYGNAMKGWRNNVFLASKTHDRSYDGSMRLIEKSLKRLKTDYIDLWQIHHIENIGEVNEVTSQGGALEALVEMKEQGVVKNLGFTGHEHPKPLIELANRFDFDTALIPLNAADKHVDPSFIKTFIPVANRRKLGIIGMKVFAQGYIFHPKGITTAWETLSYSMSLPISTIIVGCDNIAQLEENVAIARSFKPLTSSQMQHIEGKSKGYVKRSQFFRSKFGGYDSRDDLGDPHTVVGHKP
ncbi:MAG: aldo/keto reductase [Candidatus Lokiarchaeota archaeon]|nr:aldo/keto reductase [Candidatus Lokiarchaeota archaeon]